MTGVTVKIKVGCWQDRTASIADILGDRQLRLGDRESLISEPIQERALANKYLTVRYGVGE